MGISIIASEILNKSRTISVPVTYRARTYGQTNIARWRWFLELLRIWIKLHDSSETKILI